MPIPGVPFDGKETHEGALSPDSGFQTRKESGGMVIRNVRTAGATRRPLFLLALIGFFALPLVGCGGAGEEGGEEMGATEEQAEPVTLGPRDGHDLAPTDLERVAVGSVAPDFSLETIAGGTFTLSALQGAKNVVLVFYRGHW